MHEATLLDYEIPLTQGPKRTVAYSMVTRGIFRDSDPSSRDADFWSGHAPGGSISDNSRRRVYRGSRRGREGA
jgi:hypothetical protein